MRLFGKFNFVRVTSSTENDKRYNQMPVGLDRV
jgi:hypothetical protein